MYYESRITAKAEAKAQPAGEAIADAEAMLEIPINRKYQKWLGRTRQGMRLQASHKYFANTIILAGKL